MIEIHVTVSNDENKLTQRRVVYEEGIVLSRDDPVLKAIMDECVEAFGEPVDDAKMKILIAW